MHNVQFAPDGGSILFEQRFQDEPEDTLHLFSIEERRELWRIPGGDIARPAYSPDGKHAVIRVPSADRSSLEARLFNAATGREIKLATRVDCDGFLFSRDSRSFAFDCADDQQHSLVMWDLVDDRALWQVPGWRSPLAFTPDGARLLAIGDAGVGLVQATDGTPVVVLAGEPSRAVEAAAFSADGSKVILFGMIYFGSGVAGSTPYTLIGTWDARTGKQLVDFKDKGRPICSSCTRVQELPTLVDESHGGKWAIRDPFTGAERGWWPNYYRPDWSADGRILLTVEQEEVPEPRPIWDRLLKVFPFLPSPNREPCPTIRLWDTFTIRELAHLPNQKVGMFSANGRVLAPLQNGAAPVINSWDVPPRASLLRPVAWSLLVSLVVLLFGCWFVTRRVRMT
jgi:WD40 repeat protein